LHGKTFSQSSEKPNFEEKPRTARTAVIHEEISVSNIDSEDQAPMYASVMNPDINNDSLALTDTHKLSEYDVAAVALYDELKRLLVLRNTKKFDKVVTQARKISKKLRGKGTLSVIGQMAAFKEPDGKSILHLAAEVAVQEEDLFFFSRLLDLKLPLYSLDADDCYPAFYLT
jgi:hypothetical protein